MDTQYGQTIPIDNTDRRYDRCGNSGASWDPNAQKGFELAEGFGPSLTALVAKSKEYLYVRNKIFKELKKGLADKLCSLKNILNDQAK